MEWVSWSGPLVLCLGVAVLLAGAAAVAAGWSLHGVVGAGAGLLLTVLGRVCVAGDRRWRRLREAA